MEEVGGNINAVTDRYVSPMCFADPELRARVRGMAGPEKCSYTLRRGAAPLSEVARLIRQALGRFYDHADNAGLHWDNEDGTYLGTTWDTDELISENVELTDGSPWEIIEDIARGLGYALWCEADPYGASREQVLRWSWDRFVEIVRHERRFFFHEHGVEEDDHEHVRPAMLLEALASGCEEADLFKTLKAGESFWRCRTRKSRERFSSPRELGPPPRESALQNRMSPAGIPMFYGATRIRTAKLETLDGHGYWALAKFEIARDCTILDLTDVPLISLFDAEREDLYEWSRFMQAFLKDFSAPVDDRHRVHIDYVPTQVVTEFFRTVATYRDSPIEGILYNSSRDEGGICIVLFMDEHAVEPDPTSLSERDIKLDRYLSEKTGGYRLKLAGLKHCRTQR
jgi:hypothetical protein